MCVVRHAGERTKGPWPDAGAERQGPPPTKVRGPSGRGHGAGALSTSRRPPDKQLMSAMAFGRDKARTASGVREGRTVPLREAAHLPLVALNWVASSV